MRFRFESYWPPGRRRLRFPPAIAIDIPRQRPLVVELVDARKVQVSHERRVVGRRLIAHVHEPQGVVDRDGILSQVAIDARLDGAFDAKPIAVIPQNAIGADLAAEQIVVSVKVKAEVSRGKLLVGGQCQLVSKVDVAKAGQDRPPMRDVSSQVHFEAIELRAVVNAEIHRKADIHVSGKYQERSSQNGRRA